MPITTSDVSTALNAILADSPFQDGTKVITLNNGFVPLNTFVNLFGNSADMTASSLQAIDAGKLGYESYILEWQQKGYIK